MAIKQNEDLRVGKSLLEGDAEGLFDIHTTVLIAGAGPAGSTASLFLCKEKIPHVIIDKASFPRDKICGDALSGKVVDVLKRLDGNILQEVYDTSSSFLGSYGVKFGAPNGNTVDVPFKANLASLSSPPGFLSRRIHFDNFLFKKIDRSVATVLENCSLKEIKYTAGGVHCTAEREGKSLNIYAKMVVGAEGDRSMVTKQLSKIRKQNKYYCAGLRAYYTGVSGMHEKNFIELHFLKELLPGYLWVFPLPDGGANVGVGMLSSVVSKRKINLKQVMLDSLKNNPILKERFVNAAPAGEIKGWGLPLGSKKRKISGRRFLLAGDAASLIDPFTGEGISNAMTSGMLAAEQIKRSVQVQRFDANYLSAYDKAVYGVLWSELRISRTLQRFSKYPKLFNYVVNKAAVNADFRNMITCMFDDLELRKRLNNPRLYLKLLFR
jgi:geranylgeranyl reductase family protein